MVKLFVVIFAVLFPQFVLAQSGIPVEPIEPELSVTEEFFRARVVEMVESRDEETERFNQWYRLLRLQVLDGSLKGQEVLVEDEGVIGIDNRKIPELGETVVVGRVTNQDQATLFIVDTYRLPAIAWVVAIFLAIVLLFGRLKGLGAVLGLAFSIWMLVWFILPRLGAGENPVLISVIGIITIACVALYVAHGFHIRTTLALASTLLTLGLAAGLSFVFVYLARVTGFGSEEAVYLSVGTLQGVNLKGIFLAGVLIGALGVLDDITTSQVAVVSELRRANSSLSLRELYIRGTRIGKEHIAALVNTLVLAYAGASLPMLLLFSINNSQPWWVILNSDFMAEEIIRTLVGSSALILAVPIATLLAAWYFSKKEVAASDQKVIHLH